ncbi:Type I transmembrane sorting receptor [Agyrium rufum]|nr:Type I transmembrane sorting receptor [Agyrium rufum]
MLASTPFYLIILNIIVSNALPFSSPKTHLTVHLVPKAPVVHSSGLSSILKTYAKYHASLPSSVLNAASAAPGTAPVTPTEYDAEYLVPVKIVSSGITSGTTYNLDLDTGNNVLEVYSTTTKTVTSTVSIGGTVVTNEPVVYTQSSGGFSNDADSDGLLGLGPTGTFFVNAVKQGLTPAVFTVDLKKGAVGTLSFGVIDKNAYKGSITYVSANVANGFWEFNANGYAVGSASFVAQTIDAIVDTGTTLLYLPQSIVTAYYAKVLGSSNSATYGGYVFPCSSTLPTLTVGIGSYKAVVPGSYLNYAPVASGSTTCFGGLQSNTGIGFSILGDTFLKSQFVVFQGVTKQMLGFAAKPT